MPRRPDRCRPAAARPPVGRFHDTGLSLYIERLLHVKSLTQTIPVHGTHTVPGPVFSRVEAGPNPAAAGHGAVGSTGGRMPGGQRPGQDRRWIAQGHSRPLRIADGGVPRWSMSGKTCREPRSSGGWRNPVLPTNGYFGAASSSGMCGSRPQIRSAGTCAGPPPS